MSQKRTQKEIPRTRKPSFSAPQPSQATKWVGGEFCKTEISNACYEKRKRKHISILLPSVLVSFIVPAFFLLPSLVQDGIGPLLICMY